MILLTVRIPGGTVEQYHAVCMELFGHTYPISDVDVVPGNHMHMAYMEEDVLVVMDVWQDLESLAAFQWERRKALYDKYGIPEPLPPEIHELLGFAANSTAIIRE